MGIVKENKMATMPVFKLLISIDFIEGTPKQLPITKEAPKIPETNGIKKVFPNPFELEYFTSLKLLSLLILNSLLNLFSLYIFSLHVEVLVLMAIFIKKYLYIENIMALQRFLLFN